MEGSGFHQPQFSEDVAWLPPWLNPHKLSLHFEQVNDTQTFSQVAHRDLKHIQRSDGQNTCSFLRGEVGFNGCLFLSGETNLSLERSPSMQNMAPFHLHLSSDYYAERSSSQVPQLNISLENRTLEDRSSLDTLKGSHILSLQPIPQIPFNPNNRGSSRNFEESMPQTVKPKKAKQSSLAHLDKSSKDTHPVSLDSRYLKSADMDDAVELSVAASEALAISDLVKSSFGSESYSSSVILKIALKVKMARKQCCVDEFDVSSASIEEFNGNNDLSDLDDNSMADAFDDVGLCPVQIVNSGVIPCSNAGILDNNTSPLHPERNVGQCHEFFYSSKQSLVKECSSKLQNTCSACKNDTHVSNTCLSKSLGRSDGENERPSIDIKSKGEHVFSTIPSQGSVIGPHVDRIRSNDSLSQSLPEEHMGLCPNDSCGSRGIICGANELQSVAMDDSVMATTIRITSKESNLKEEGLNLFSIGPCKKLSSFWTQDSIDGVEGGKVEHALIIEPFKSRWLGGWTGKEAGMNADSTCKRNNGMPNLFVGETSFFSESVEVVDECSSVHKQETRLDIGTSGLQHGDLCSNIDNEITFSQTTLVRLSNSYQIDPLCSFVACSIDVENAHLGLSPNQQNNREEYGKDSNLNNEELVEIESLDPSTMLPSSEVATSPMASTHPVQHVQLEPEDSGHMKRTEMFSLKNYSTRAPNGTVCWEAQGVDVSVGSRSSLINTTENNIFSSYSNCDHSRSSKHHNSLYSIGILNSKLSSMCMDVGNCRTSNFQFGKQTERNQLNSTTNNEFLESEADTLNCDRTANDGIKVQSDPLEGDQSPSILNFGKRRRVYRTIESKESEEDSQQKASISYMRKFISSNDKEVNNGGCEEYASCVAFHSHQDEGKNLKRKRVRFSEADIRLHQYSTCQKSTSQVLKCLSRTTSSNRTAELPKKQNRKSSRRGKASASIISSKQGSENGKCYPTANCRSQKGLIFQGLEFMLTGFSSKKRREFEMLIRKNGGVVLCHIPAPSINIRGKRVTWYKNQKLPIILSPEKVQTSKFLYGCAINTALLKPSWLTDSIAAGFVLPPERYKVISSHSSEKKQMERGQSNPRSNHMYIFERLGIMLYGKLSFCTKMATVIKHGGGQVFKTMKWLVESLRNRNNTMGIIIIEDAGRATRHLRHCASEHKLPVMPSSWIINSLLLGRLLPTQENDPCDIPRTAKATTISEAIEESEEI
ncbi:uncharacterized protein LOC18427133 isoform X1 [Amborella trichopoda]|uniref:uncharacterized protein LOC18427133 isoform X1 n=2 Tax=Amborella trichopoda TaxID=13333 RepID=UPI0009BF07E8|nr:uncharacterized protein LOC18427133 isoform X1 [Amborella trichopoda]|eukprot:XP_020518553.1 uncharacterized protein LOC18427133 isoform X1 [Amborella trichopoda]